MDSTCIVSFYTAFAMNDVIFIKQDLIVLTQQCDIFVKPIPFYKTMRGCKVVTEKQNILFYYWG